jgi:hypothetical protein
MVHFLMYHAKYAVNDNQLKNVILSHFWNQTQTSFLKLKHAPTIFMNEGIGFKLMLKCL